MHLREVQMNVNEARKLCEERAEEDRHLVGCLDCGYEWMLDYEYNGRFHVEMCVCCGSVDIGRKQNRLVQLAAG